MALNVKQSDFLATLDKKLKRYRRDNLSWLLDVTIKASRDLSPYTGIYETVLVGPSYDFKGRPRKLARGIWVSWPPTVPS